MYQQIRSFFFENDVLEVETPIFSHAGNPDPCIDNLTANFSAGNSNYPMIRYAHTSPEFAMKRLLAQGVGSMFQICKVFRRGELGRLHNPEFSMLEWYRLEFSYSELMDEIESLLSELAIADTCTRISFADLFMRYLGVDILNASMDELKQLAKQKKLDVVGLADDYNTWCNLLLSHLIEPELKQYKALFVYDYPVSQAALATIRPGKPGVAERFELYLNGIEIANGYQELTDSNEYLDRFNRENHQRLKQGLEEIPVDKKMLSAMQAGLGKCAGVAIGLDRLLMCRLKATSIGDVLIFPFNDA